MVSNRLPNHIKSFFNARKITDKVLEDFRVGWDGSRIVYPVIGIGGEILFRNYRRDPAKDGLSIDVGPKYMYDKGSHVSLYGIHVIGQSKRILITEGQNDCLVAWSFNIPSVTSTGGSMSFQERWISEYGLNDCDVLVCLDNDEAGGKGMARILKMLPNAKIVLLPDRAGVKDISDYVSSGGDLNELLKTAMSFNSKEDVEEDRDKRVATWQSTFFHDAFLHEIAKDEQASLRVEHKRIVGDKLERARSYPITDLIKFNRRGMAPCIWHNEKAGSLHYYKDTNTVYCFGCSKFGDAIDVCRQIRGCGFNEALEALQ